MSCCGCCGPPSSPEPTDGGCSRCLGITKEARTWLPLKQNLHNVRWNDGKIISIYFNLFQSISTHINHVFQLADVSFFKRNHSILDLHLLEFQAGWEGARESAWEIQEKGPGAARKIHGKIPDKSRHLVWDLFYIKYPAHSCSACSEKRKSPSSMESHGCSKWVLPRKSIHPPLNANKAGTNGYHGGLPENFRGRPPNSIVHECYPLVICYIAIERSTILIGKPW